MTGARRGTLTMAVLAAACGVLSPEEQLLTRFFEASRLYDTTAVASMSAVTFNPRTDGIVREFEVERIQRAGTTADVFVSATIATPEGQLVERMLRARLEQRGGRWFIAAIE